MSEPTSRSYSPPHTYQTPVGNIPPNAVGGNVLPRATIHGTLSQAQFLAIRSQSGPLPPADQLAEYHAIDPQIALDIVAMAKQGHAAEIKSKLRQQSMQYSMDIFHLVAGLLFAAGSLYLTYLLGMAGKEWLAAITATTTLSIGIGAIVLKRLGRLDKPKLRAPQSRQDVHDSPSGEIEKGAP